MAFGGEPCTSLLRIMGEVKNQAHRASDQTLETKFS